MPKSKGEILGVVIVESGWGSMLPTVVIANLAPAGAAARCGQLNIGDQIIAINGVSLVGLPLSTCQNYIKVLFIKHIHKYSCQWNHHKIVFLELKTSNSNQIDCSSVCTCSRSKNQKTGHEISTWI